MDFTKGYAYLFPISTLFEYSSAFVVFTLLCGQNAFSFELKEPFETPLGRKYETELKILIVPANQLPSGCRLTRETTGTAIFPATTNPFVTEDEKLIQFVSRFVVGEKQLDNVKAAFSVLFTDKEPRFEVGIWGLSFEDEKAASEALAQTKFGDVLVKDSLMLTVWHDTPDSKPCLRAIERHLKGEGFKKVQKG